MRPIPATFGGVTIEWCRARLQDCLDDRLLVADITPMADGRFGTTARLSLTWAHGQGPPAMIIKLVSASPGTRRAGRLYRSYEVEAGFYQDMAWRIGAHVARCYFAEAVAHSIGQPCPPGRIRAHPDRR